MFSPSNVFLALTSRSSPSSPLLFPSFDLSNFFFHFISSPPRSLFFYELFLDRLLRNQQGLGLLHPLPPPAPSHRPVARRLRPGPVHAAELPELPDRGTAGGRGDGAAEGRREVGGAERRFHQGPRSRRRGVREWSVSLVGGREGLEVGVERGKGRGEGGRKEGRRSQ